MSTNLPTTMFLFEMSALLVDPSGYRIPNWDKAIPVSVVESTLELAKDKCRAMLGKTRTGLVWSLLIQSAKEVY